MPAPPLSCPAPSPCAGPRPRRPPGPPRGGRPPSAAQPPPADCASPASSRPPWRPPPPCVLAGRSWEATGSATRRRWRTSTPCPLLDVANIQACDTAKCDVYVCPSPLHVAYCTGKFTNGAKVTPQNCNFKGCGAFTGETSVEQMKDMGIEQVLIGHSERRGEFGIFPMDDNNTLATKLKYILDAGMSCVYCIGEPKEIREKGLDAVLEEMHVQLTPIYGLLDPAKVVIAYEPVWAIGTGLTATPEAR
ncbi:unnamed protein product, partial [Prorocentrum cordatum]